MARADAPEAMNAAPPPLLQLLVYCAGGFGREVMDMARRANAAQGRWSAIGFIDDFCETPTRYGAAVSHFAALPSACAESAALVIATGEPAARAMLRERVGTRGFTLDQVIDPSTIIAPTATVGAGTIAMPFCSISSDAVLADNICINTMSIIGHDVHIGRDCAISSMVNLGGGCTVGERSYIGMGALIKEGVRIGSDCIIGMGSVVYNDIPDGVIALGNPARPMRPNTNKQVFP